MSVTSGFFNSLNHDRRYNAQQMSAIFDGIINDGVFANIGVAFAVNADTGVTITIGKGKCWFNSAWVYNDTLLPKTLEASEMVLDRIDAAVIEVDHNEAVRMGDIKIVKGIPSSSPKRPTMVDTEKKSQHPLAYIYRKAGSTEITQADITNMVGTSECPYITGILQVQNIDNIVAQWEGQWNQWYAEKIAETDSDASELLAEMKSDFEIWFADIQSLLDDDAATALAAQVAELQGKFDDLARDSCVYDTVEDSDLDVILGSDGTPIKGKTVFGAGGSGSEDITPESIGALAVTGGKMLGDIDMNGQKLHGLDEPVDPDEPATKGYNDSQILNRVIYGKGKNLLKNTAKSQTINGVTFTVNDDGSVTANGKNTSQYGAFFTVSEPNLVVLENAILQGCPNGGSTDTFTMYAYSSTSAYYYYDTGNGSEIPKNETIKSVTIRVNSGVTVNNLTFYPMIRLASETDDTYEPYYKGLAELTDRGMELKWRNASPTSSFAEQNVVLDFSGYDFYGVLAAFNNAADATTRFFMTEVGKGLEINISSAWGTLSGRKVTVSNNGLTFWKGITTGGSENNTFAIPLRIYVFKGESA